MSVGVSQPVTPRPAHVSSFLGKQLSTSPECSMPERRERRRGCDLNLETEGGEPFQETLGGAGGIDPVEIVVAKIAVRGPVAQHVVNDDENFVSGNDDRLGPAAAGLCCDRRKHAGSRAYSARQPKLPG